MNWPCAVDWDGKIVRDIESMGRYDNPWFLRMLSAGYHPPDRWWDDQGPPGFKGYWWRWGDTCR